MLKKFFSLILIGVLGLLILPDFVYAKAKNVNVEINYNGGVSSDKFIVDYCTAIDSNGDCTLWAETDDKENITISLKDTMSLTNYIRISKNSSVSGFATKNYTVIYETAITNVVDGVPINNFIDLSANKNENSMSFKLEENDNVPNNKYVISIYPTLKSFV